jgi:hypothetical protein
MLYSFGTVLRKENVVNRVCVLCPDGTDYWRPGHAFTRVAIDRLVAR